MERCPECGSRAVEPNYLPLPDFSDEPGLYLVMAAEAQIPRLEGVMLPREMLAWLRFHGVRDRAEIITWEWFFREIGGIRARIVEEMTAPAPGKGGEEEREE